MKNILSLVLMILLSIIFLPIKKKSNKIIINSFKNNKYNFYSRVFFEYLIKNKEKNNLIVKFVINNKEERDRLNQTIGPYFIDSKTLKGTIEILSSKYWISSCKPIYSFPLALFNRIKINVWHGVPFKTIALKDKNQNKIKKIIYKYYYSNIFYDLFFCSSSETSKLFKESFSLNEKNIYIGGSLAGEMFGESIDKTSNDVVKNLLQQGRKKKVLYAPTYRDNGKTIYFPFSEMEKNEFESFLKEHDITIYVRPHHLDQGYKKYITWDGIEYFGSDLVPEITFYLKEFNILISDYSSIIFDYMLTDGYQILLPYDESEYERARGLNYKIKDLSYGKIVFSYVDFKNSIAFPYENIDRKNKLKNRFHSIDSFQCNKLLNRIIVENKNERNN